MSLIPFSYMLKSSVSYLAVCAKNYVLILAYKYYASI